MIRHLPARPLPSIGSLLGQAVLGSLGWLFFNNGLELNYENGDRSPHTGE